MAGSSEYLTGTGDPEQESFSEADIHDPFAHSHGRCNMALGQPTL